MHIKDTVSSRSKWFDLFHGPNYIMQMKRQQAFKFALKLTPGQKKQLAGFAGCCRFIYNKALALQKERFDHGDKKLTYGGLCKQLTAWRHDPLMDWLKQAPSQALQQSLKDLERAYQNFFMKRAGFPKFKKRGRHDSFRLPQGMKIDEDNSRIFLPKIGWIRYCKSQAIIGEINSITISKHCDRWFVSIQTEHEAEAPLHPSTTAIGVDVGIAQLATLSDGTVFPPVNSFKSHQSKLIFLQHRMSKKKRFSKNWKKAAAKVGRLHRKIACIRHDYLHKLTHTLSKNHAMICIEDLQVKNMSKSASGTKDQPGKRVKAKSGLNKAILDQGWHEFRRQLEYKQSWRGGIVIAVSPHYTSQTCPLCKHVEALNRPSQSKFVCMKCGYDNHADVVGAMNILRAGHARLACGETVQLGHSMNQEPTDVIQALVV